MLVPFGSSLVRSDVRLVVGQTGPVAQTSGHLVIERAQWARAEARGWIEVLVGTGLRPPASIQNDSA